MRRLLLPLLAIALAACSSAPKKSPPPSAAIGKGAPPFSGSATPQGGCSKTYAPAQEDLSKRGDYKAGGLYAPGVADTTPDYIPDVDCIAEPRISDEPRSPVGNRSPYTVLGKKYHVMDRVEGYVEEGTASYYGSKFHGRRTSNQEVYDMYAFTAAHKSLPLPSFARVTNLDNGQSVVVRVNDRGPFHSGRVIDLSYAAAVKLGITQRGTGRVQVRALTGKDQGVSNASAAPRPAPVKTTIATGVPTRIATGKPTAMDQLVEQLPRQDADASASEAAVSPSQPWRYHVTPEPAQAPSADEFETWMQSRGVRVATGKPAALASANAAARAPMRNAESSPSPSHAAARSASGAASGDVQLQVASFASRENADRALARLSAAGIARATLNDIDSNGRTLWRLRVEAPDSATASELAGRIASLGFGQPQVVRE
jgi:rare lipoprotein A